MRREELAQADGSYLLQSRQVAGGMGENAKMDSDLRLQPLPGGATAWSVSGVFGMPSFIPDFIIKRMMNTPDDKNPQLKELERLRAQVRARKPRPPLPSPSAAPPHRARP